MVDAAIDTRELVRISGRGGLVNIKIDDDAPISVACRTLREYLSRQRDLYSKGQVIVDIGKRILSHDQQELIRKVIGSESGLEIKQFWCEPEVLELERRRIDSLIDLHSAISSRVNGSERGGSSTPAESDPEAISPPESGAEAEGQSLPGSAGPGEERRSVPADVVRGTCRAGEVQRFPGNVVVVGNVNPGAQIIAQGDILVFGKLRGLAHAGAGGDSTAVILAMSSAAPQLRIADHLWDANAERSVAGRRVGHGDDGPIIARIRNRSVHVSPYLKNHSIDHGGNPNER
ncbi:MAG: hypothetical protein F4X64_00055 [Chloroflexi bacterium]|nr:hypothetical protein [Chloroflexota bacterium]